MLNIESDNRSTPSIEYIYIVVLFLEYIYCQKTFKIRYFKTFIQVKYFQSNILAQYLLPNYEFWLQPQAGMNTVRSLNHTSVHVTQSQQMPLKNCLYKFYTKYKPLVSIKWTFFESI